MATPLFKPLKENGTTLYVFPGAEEDINASQTTNYKFSISHFALVNFPRQDGSQVEDIDYSEFINSSIFPNSVTDPASTYGDAVVAAIRNYVANRDTTIRSSRSGPSSVFYNPTEPLTVTERNFWKWLNQAGLISFEPALPDDEYDADLTSAPTNPDPSYFPEILWKEREVRDYSATIVVSGTTVYLQIGDASNFRVGDNILIKLDTPDSGIDSKTISGDIQYLYKVESVASTSQRNDLLRISRAGVPDWYSGANLFCTATLYYNRFVQYVGNVQAQSNVVKADKSWREANAFVPENNGQTPDILFRIESDLNYSPGLRYPLLASQEQPEIIGAEILNSPIVTSPNDYPGDQYAYFDLGLRYKNSDGDYLRRTGNYYGVLATDRDSEFIEPYDTNLFDGRRLDGVCLEFDTSKYTKMNQPGKIIKNFDEFNAQPINNEPPKDFEFNAILWYYTIEDEIKGTTETNLYGIEFLDNPLNNKVTEFQFPVYKKLVRSTFQAGTSYNFTLSQVITVSEEGLVEIYDPERVYNTINFELYSEAIRRLVEVTDVFVSLSAQVAQLTVDLNNTKQLIYSDQQLDVLNRRLTGVENDITRYKTMQIEDSESIKVIVTEDTPPVLRLESIDKGLGNIVEYFTSAMYQAETNQSTITAVAIPEGKDLMVIITNDDTRPASPTTLPKVYLDKDLEWKQSVEFIIKPAGATENKKIILGITDIELGTYELPIDRNPDNTPNYSTTIKESTSFWGKNIWLEESNNDYYMNIELDITLATTLKYETVLVESAYIIISNTVYDFSGQYQFIPSVLSNPALRIRLNQSFMPGLFDIVNDGTALNENGFTFYSIYDSAILNVTKIGEFKISVLKGWSIKVTNAYTNLTGLDKYLVKINKL